jgi:hypothetical protein
MDNVFFSNTWTTVTTFNTANNSSTPINYFIKSNGDGTDTIYKDDLTELSKEELSVFNEMRQIGRGIITKNEYGFLSESGFDKAVSNLTLKDAKKDNIIDRLPQYGGFKWSYTTSTSGIDLLVRYLSNLSLPVPFIDIALKNDEEWGQYYNTNDDMRTFSNSDNIDNIIKLYFKIKKPPIKIRQTSKNIAILKIILNQRIVINAASGPRKIIQELMLKTVSCINENCYRAARTGPSTESAKMRQECNPCTNRESDSEKVEGISLVPIYDNKKFTGEYDLDNKNFDVVFVCPRFCSNSETQFLTNSLPWKILPNKRPEPIQYDNEKKKLFNQYLTNKNKVKFFCPVQPDKYELMNSGAFQIDHINGNHWDNSYKNVQTLCSICHDLKSSLAGDKGTKKTDTITSTINEEIDKYMNLTLKKKTKFKTNIDIRYFNTTNLYILFENLISVYKDFCKKNNLDPDTPFFDVGDDDDDDEEKKDDEPVAAAAAPLPPPISPNQQKLNSIDSFKNKEDLKTFFLSEMNLTKSPRGFSGKGETLEVFKDKIKAKLKVLYKIS